MPHLASCTFRFRRSRARKPAIIIRCCQCYVRGNSNEQAPCKESSPEEMKTWVMRDKSGSQREGVPGRKSSWARLGESKCICDLRWWNQFRLAETNPWSKQVKRRNIPKPGSSLPWPLTSEREKWHCCDLGEYQSGSSSLWLWPLGDSDISWGSFGQKSVPWI